MAADLAPVHTPGYASSKADHLTRLRRIEGQVRGLQRMIDEDKYCIDVLTQISSVNRALQSVALGLLDEHLHHCVAGAMTAGGAEATAKLDEATRAIERLVRS
jgi:CsoR family transcriptional regulator, copper-sensing transcriptional repressor